MLQKTFTLNFQPGKGEMGGRRKGGGNSHIKWTGVLFIPFRGLKAGVGPYLVFNLKMSKVGVFAVHFRVFELEKLLKNY